MTTRFFRFDSEAQYKKVIESISTKMTNTEGEDFFVLPEGFEVNVVGEVVRVVKDTEGNDQHVKLEGFHVNTPQIEVPKEFEKYEVFPSNPVCVYAS